MTPGARWWIDRLRAMSLAEVVHRSVRLARAPIDRARVDRLPARLADWRGPAVFVFDDAAARAPIADDLRATAEALLVGRQVVLGLGELTLPDEPWHLEPITGDPRTTWELNRGHGWVVLARAYAATRDPRFRDRLLRELRSWRRHNPVGRGINWASAMEAAIRCHAFAWIAALLRGDGAICPLLAELLFAHAGFVARHLSRFSSANNHLIVELSGLVVAGRVLDVPRWHVIDPLAREAERQTLPDGVNVEMATHYHMFVLEALLLVAWLERAHGRPARPIEHVIARMATYLDAITTRAGDVLHQGDNDDGKILPLFEPRPAEQLLWAARALFASRHAATAERLRVNLDPYRRDRRFSPGEADRQRGGIDRFPPSEPPGEAARLLCNGESPPAGTAPTCSQVFRAAGQVVLRGARVHATFDAGPFGFGALAAHAHCDALAVSVAFDDRPFVVTRGTYRYLGDRTARDRDRATAAHNTVQIGAREQADIAGPFLWSRKPITAIEHCDLDGARDVVRARHDGFAPARHVRTVIRIGDTLAVIDEIRDPPAGEPVIARWHLAPGAAPAKIDDGFVIVHDGAARWLWFGCDAQPLRARAITTPHAARYLARQPACTLEVELPDPRRRLVTLLGPDADHRATALRQLLPLFGSPA